MTKLKYQRVIQWPNEDGCFLILLGSNGGRMAIPTD